MGRENVANWSVRKCAKSCIKCEKAFADKEAIYSRLSFEQGLKKRTGLSSWWLKSKNGKDRSHTSERVAPDAKVALAWRGSVHREPETVNLVAATLVNRFLS